MFVNISQHIYYKIQAEKIYTCLLNFNIIALIIFSFLNLVYKNFSIIEHCV